MLTRESEHQGIAEIPVPARLNSRQIEMLEVSTSLPLLLMQALLRGRLPSSRHGSILSIDREVPSSIGSVFSESLEMA